MRSFGRIQANTFARSRPSSTPRSCGGLPGGFDSLRRDQRAERRIFDCRGIERADRKDEILHLGLAATGLPRRIGRRRDPARTRPKHRDIRAARDVPHGVNGFIDSLDIGVETPVALFGGRVSPADAEDLNAFAQQELDHALVGRQIQRIEFVDLRRNDEDRARPNLRRHRLILNELEDLGAKHHRPGCGREVLAHLKRLGVRPATACRRS